MPGLTGAETLWYVLMNFAFGAGYFAKVIAADAISELPSSPGPGRRPPSRHTLALPPASPRRRRSCHRE